MTDGAPGPAALGRTAAPPGRWRDLFPETTDDTRPLPVVRAASLAYALAAIGLLAWGVRGVVQGKAGAQSLLGVGIFVLYPASLAWTIRRVRPGEMSRAAFTTFFLPVFAHAVVGALGAAEFALDAEGDVGGPFAILAFYATAFGWTLMVPVALESRGWSWSLLSAVYGFFAMIAMLRLVSPSMT